MGRYIHGKQTETISFQYFDSKLQATKLDLKYKSLIAFLYLAGCRISEALSRVKEDFNVEENTVVINIPTKKQGQRMFLEFDLSWPYVKDLILPHVDGTRRGQRVWDFTSRTAERKVKKVLGLAYYPHFFRLNAAVSFCRNKDTTIQDIKAWFGWKRIETINEYMGLARRDISEARKKRGLEFNVNGT